eukprot:CAMPEP_0171287100 /NCGR_PEP_ID=MMETSP0790-20130122/69372_1 /TAXON_ID=2925 /ORGANISM="Alexandrium catenella, Strain OF101" /LENGTH=64 /DNA_ID=CAMNT_0011756601 /DNA_START=18 /DNA_END=208 /DNA_ORIENTATION=+
MPCAEAGGIGGAIGKLVGQAAKQVAKQATQKAAKKAAKHEQLKKSNQAKAMKQTQDKHTKQQRG